MSVYLLECTSGLQDIGHGHFRGCSNVIIPCTFSGCETFLPKRTNGTFLYRFINDSSDAFHCFIVFKVNSTRTNVAGSCLDTSMATGGSSILRRFRILLFLILNRNLTRLVNISIKLRSLLVRHKQANLPHLLLIE